MSSYFFKFNIESPIYAKCINVKRLQDINLTKNYQLMKKKILDFIVIKKTIISNSKKNEIFNQLPDKK